MNKQQELDQLRTELRQRERERDELWSGAFWWWIFFWPVLVYLCIKKKKQSNRLNEQIRDLQDRIRDLEKET